MSLRKIYILVLLMVGWFGAAASAVELNDVYRQLGDYRIVASSGIRLYFPQTAEKAVPRILTAFSQVRERLIEFFPEQKKYEATVILNDHDDRISSSADSDFDWINLGMFEEIGVLSTRAYSLEKRFAMRLANILILRTLAASSNSWRRQLAMLAVPQWFMDGMALSYAFPLDSIHYSRLLDMARHDRLYSLDQLSTILSQSTMVREEMTFQAHSMFEYWEKTYKKGAALDLMKSIFRKPAGFEKLFKAHFGVSLKEAYKSYRDYVCEKCGELKEKASAQEFEIEDHGAGGADGFVAHAVDLEVDLVLALACDFAVIDPPGGVEGPEQGDALLAGQSGLRVGRGRSQGHGSPGIRQQRTWLVYLDCQLFRRPCAARFLPERLD
ncbi:MAG TPA: hypothetical protein PLR50_12585, partial [Candidatus Rifleibacterium sp.]|nr:hypothetical protein [Candidatus Rifleibacterium sp.]